MSETKTNIKESYNYCFSDKFDIEDNEERRIYVNCDIDENIINFAVYHILRYNRMDKDIPINERKPIKIYISTPGGVVTAGYALIDAIMTSKTPVYTINLGTAYSMGFLIFIAGTKRFSMPSATYLLHDGSSFAWDSTNKLRIELNLKRVKWKNTQRNILLKEQIFRKKNIWRTFVRSGTSTRKKQRNLEL